MARFFKENLLGIVIVSAIGGVLGNVLTTFLPSARDGAALLTRPIPAWFLFPYSLIVTLAMGVWAVNSRRKEHVLLLAREAVATQQATVAEVALNNLRSDHQAVVDALDAARQQLEAPVESPLTKSQLMGLVAVVLAGAPASALNPTNHYDVCRHVAGLAGVGVPHAAIGDALASMLKIGAVESDYRGLTLSSTWKEKLTRSFPE